MDNKDTEKPNPTTTGIHKNRNRKRKNDHGQKNGDGRESPRNACRESPRNACRESPRNARRESPRNAYRESPRNAHRESSRHESLPRHETLRHPDNPYHQLENLLDHRQGPPHRQTPRDMRRPAPPRINMRVVHRGATGAAYLLLSCSASWSVRAPSRR